MQVNRAATMQLEWIGAQATVVEAAERMRRANVGLLLVADNNVLLGVLTDRDIVTRGMATGRPPERVTTMEIMSDPVVCIDGDADLGTAARLMADKQVRRLVVTNNKRQPVGVLSLDDIAFATHGGTMAGQVLEELAHGPQSAALFRSA
jgi:CBS domain-containing protein